MSARRTTRKSFGIACCRSNPVTKKQEVLLVRKRYTYNYVAFVLGQYNKNDDDEILLLLNGMTMQEKIDIMSLRFELVWFKIWLEFPDRLLRSRVSVLEKQPVCVSDDNTWNTINRKAMKKYDSFDYCDDNRISFYLKKKQKYESAFMIDKGERLCDLVSKSTSVDLMWEIPKGRKNKNESPVECAIREFEEETGIGVGMYNIVFNTGPVVESYDSMDVQYIHTYYVAHTSCASNPSINTKSKYQLAEIDAIRWMNIDEIHFVDHTNRHLSDTTNAVFEKANLEY